MQYRSNIDPTLPSVYDTPGHSLSAAAHDAEEIAQIVESMRAGGYDARRPVILVVNACSLECPAWRWSGDHEITIAQGRHRWLAAIEAGVEVAAILVSHDELEQLGAHGDANDIEDHVMTRIDELMASEGEDVHI